MKISSLYFKEALFILLALIIIGLIFLIDLNTEICIGSAYAIAILYSWILRGKYISLYVGLFCSFLVLCSFIYNYPEEPDNYDFGVNYIVSIVVIWVCLSILTIAKQALDDHEKSRSILSFLVERKTVELKAKINQLNLKQEELRRSELKFKTLMESAPDAMVMVGRDGKILLVNAQTENIFGYKSKDMIGKSMEMLIPKRFADIHPEHRKKYFDSPTQRPMGANLELSAIRKDGEEFAVEVSLSPIKAENETLVVAAIRDISERKKIEKVNAFAKEIEVRNKELEQFAYVASHDLREPLITVQNMISLLKDEFNEHLPNDAQEYLHYIDDASSRMNELVKALLDYSRIGKSGSVVNIDTNKIVEQIIEDLSFQIKQCNAQISKSTLPEIKGLEHELSMLFQNIISNAIKYRAKDQSPVIHITYNEDSDFWNFHIKDNGIGIEEQYLTKIFNAFQRLHSKDEYEGTGIGLAHCKKIIELHGGYIWAESTVGEGTIIHFSIAK